MSETRSRKREARIKRLIEIASEPFKGELLLFYEMLGSDSNINENFKNSTLKNLKDKVGI